MERGVCSPSGGKELDTTESLHTHIYPDNMHTQIILPCFHRWLSSFPYFFQLVKEIYIILNSDYILFPKCFIRINCNKFQVFTRNWALICSVFTKV